jgi:glucose/arabinose dehydrogenase
MRSVARLAPLAILLAAALPADAARATGLQRLGRFAQPVYVTAPVGQGARVFVVERGGRIRVVRRGRKLARPFLDIRGLVQFFDSRHIEADQGGLLSMAFPPDYGRSGRFYVVYTRLHEIRVEEFRRSPSSPDRALRSSRRPLLALPRLTRNDIGGQLQFGPDGLLYAGFGYGRDAASAQDLSQLTGKLLRIDPQPDVGRPYRIPVDNPYVLRAGTRPEIYASGLRVPWRFSFDRRTGDLAIGDVGEHLFEELDFVRRSRVAGANFGWPLFEGRRRMRPDSPAGLVRPVLARRHPREGCAAIIGGYVVRDPSLRGLRGRYLYGDLCRQRLRSVKLATPRASGDRAERLTVPFPLVSFGEDGRGRLYAISLEGSVLRLVR